MDTIILQRSYFEKTVSSAAGIGIALCLILSQTSLIPAKGVDFGIYTGISPAINYMQAEQNKKEQDFDKTIKSKYFGGKITDIDKGVKHIKLIRYYNGRPVRLNIVETSRDINNNLEIVPSIASSKDNLASRVKIADIAKREKAIVAINGGYFKPQTGVPLGTLMIDKTMYTGPIFDRVAMGIGDDGYVMGRVKLKTALKTNIGELKIDNINQPRMLSTHVIVYTPKWGEYSPPSPKYGMQLAVSDGKLAEVGTNRCIIPKDGFVIVGPQKQIENFVKAKKFKLDINTNPSWDNIDHIISGGPYLIKNGEIFLDTKEQRLSSIGGRNPRTAIGYTKDNNFIMLTADGREGSSIGLTLFELASLMKEFGCVNAMNLDGGGSTVMYVQGQIVNKPQVSGGIPLSNTIVITHKTYS